MQQLVEEIHSYKTMLWLLNCRDDQVALFKQTWERQIIYMMLSLVRLFLSLMFVLPGYIMMFPLSSYISIYAEKERIKALKGSVVKIKGYDVLATTKTVAYISTFPIYLTLFTYIFFKVLTNYYDYGRSESYGYTFIFFLIFPYLQIISIRSHYGVVSHKNDFQGRLVSLFYPN